LEQSGDQKKPLGSSSSSCALKSETPTVTSGTRDSANNVSRFVPTSSE
jgi:hypothetical protein